MPKRSGLPTSSTDHKTEQLASLVVRRSGQTGLLKVFHDLLTNIACVYDRLQEVTVFQALDSVCH